MRLARLVGTGNSTHFSSCLAEAAVFFLVDGAESEPEKVFWSAAGRVSWSLGASDSSRRTLSEWLATQPIPSASAFVPGDGLLDGFHHGTTLALDMPVKQLKKRSTPTTTPRVHRPVVFASILLRQPSEPWAETSAFMFTLVRLLSAGAEAEDERWKVCWGGSCRLV